MHRLKTKYHHKVERKYARIAKRKQLNFNCATNITTGAKLLARVLDVPLYCVLEHSLPLGTSHSAVAMADPVEREKLVKHLVMVHLLGDELSDDENGAGLEQK